MRRVSSVCRFISSISHRSTLNFFFFLITALLEWKDGSKELHWRSKYCSFFIEFAIEMIGRSRSRFPQWTRSPSKTSCNNPRSFSPYELGSVPVVMHVSFTCMLSVFTRPRDDVNLIYRLIYRIHAFTADHCAYPSVNIIKLLILLASCAFPLHW